jgi:hypothetical protein
VRGSHGGDAGRQIGPEIGPAGPPLGFAAKAKAGGGGEKEEEEEEDVGPPMAPGSVARGEDGATRGGGREQKRARALMPMLPAGLDLEKLKAVTDQIDWERVAREEEEEEEDLLGPAAPGQVTRGFVAASVAAQQACAL